MTTPTPRGTLRPIAIAPMMDRTDRHFRFLLRCITRHSLLYTEMVVALALEHGDVDYLLAYDPAEHPVALQLGGDDPALLARCAKIAEARGYDEVNLNVGCPSDRVQSGHFGVCLMGDAARVAACVGAMRDASSLPITVKHRVGFDDRDSYEEMAAFVETVADAGCDRFTVHARKAWLQGLSPRENREIPPLRYADVHRLKAEFPHLVIEINGHLRADDDAAAQLAHVDAVMVGRAAWDDPFHLRTVDHQFFGDDTPAVTREDVIEAMLPYLSRELAKGSRPAPLVRGMLNLYAGVPGARLWRRWLTTRTAKDGAIAVIEQARDAVAQIADRRKSPDDEPAG